MYYNSRIIISNKKNTMEYLFLVSRILFGGYFVLAGINHFRNLAGTAGYAASKGVPFPKVAVIGTGLLLLLGGLGIVLGLYVRFAILLLVVFLIPVTFKMHQFWKVQDPMQKMGERINFEKNIALAGAALAYLFIALPWALAL